MRKNKNLTITKKFRDILDNFKFSSNHFKNNECDELEKMKKELELFLNFQPKLIIDDKEIMLKSHIDFVDKIIEKGKKELK